LTSRGYLPRKQKEQGEMDATTMRWMEMIADVKCLITISAYKL